MTFTTINLSPQKFKYEGNHYDPAPLPGDDRSQATLSKARPDSLIIFVHGFRGEALETWTGFDQLAIADDAFKSSDLVFFGYDGYESNVLASSSFLYDLLNRLEEDRAALVGINRPDLVKIRNQGYQRIILVAHSLGAVVCRWAILRAVEEKRDWRNKLKLLLFAPAHTGSDLAALAAMATTGFPWVHLFVEAFKANVPLVKELDPGSRILAELADRVRRSPGEPCLRASRVVIAEREIVVSNLPFPGDPCPDALRNTDHSSVCKPTPDRRQAVKFLEELLP